MATPKGLLRVSTHTDLFRHDKVVRTATVYRDPEWEEYRVIHYMDGTQQVNADYHTDDRRDAVSHAIAWITE